MEIPVMIIEGSTPMETDLEYKKPKKRVEDGSI